MQQREFLRRKCQNCKRWDTQHPDGRCLFSYEKFTPFKYSKKYIRHMRAHIREICDHKYPDGHNAFAAWHPNARYCTICNKGWVPHKRRKLKEMGTVSGRFSSSGPNIQNLPKTMLSPAAMMFRQRMLEYRERQRRIAHVLQQVIGEDRYVESTNGAGAPTGGLLGRPEGR